jgi:hypothetical protein
MTPALIQIQLPFFAFLENGLNLPELIWKLIMFNFFRKKKTEEVQAPTLILADINQFPLQEGDIVEALRYDLGRCRFIKLDKGYAYESLVTGEKVSYVRMVDAITQLQKVKKVME